VHDVWNTKAKLAQDILRWHKAGWITDEGASAIRAELASSSSGLSASSILALSGVVLLGFGAMSFVAANWHDIPKLARLLMIFTLSATAYVGAGALFERDNKAFAHASVLLGVALFGANIMQIAQMYHVAGRPRDMVLIWAAIAFLSGLLFKSGPTTSLALLLGTLWSAWESAAIGAIHWQFVPVWLSISAALLWQRASFGLYLSGAAITVWLISLGYPWWGGGSSHWVPLIVGGLAAAASIMAELCPEQVIARTGRVGLGFSLIVVFAALTGMQYMPAGDIMYNHKVSLDWYIVLSAVKLGVLIGAMWWCVERENVGVLWLAYILFSIAVLAIYLKTVGSLLGSSVFFLVAGLLVIALAWSANLLRNRTTNKSKAPS